MSYNYPFKTIDENTKLTVWAKGHIVPDKNDDNYPWSCP